MDQGLVTILNTMALAAISALLITGQLVPRPTHDWVKTQLEKAQQQVAALISERGKDIETIRDNTQALKDIVKEIDGGRAKRVGTR